MKIALTGATGFAGGPILRHLLAAGHEVKALVRRPKDGQFDARVKITKGDLDRKDALQTLVSAVDVVVHVAGAISALNESGYFKVNYAGTRNVFEAAQLARVKRFINISSISARNPEISGYAASKRAAEDYLALQADNMDILTLRPSAIYGPGDRATLPLIQALQKYIAVIPGQKHARFSLMHVEDFAFVVAQAAASDQTGLLEIDDAQGGYNWAALAGANRKLFGRPNRVAYLPRGLVTAVAIASEIGTKMTGQSGMVNRGKVNELYHGDWVARGPGWPRQNAIGLEQGLAETVTWYRANGWLPPSPQADRR
ncbi:MAG: NAD(P)-dependent oxidoreductase [Alphaproteobacteria bacterium]|nr:NAD(P)-dependent oxidoreductase [Alphaproteobacteria bacterium]